MTLQLTNERKKIKAGYDSKYEYLREGEEMSHTIAHEAVIAYLRLVLVQLFAGQKVGVVTDVELTVAGDAEIEAENKAIYISPDISVIDGLTVSETNALGLYRIGPGKPPPRVVFEIGSQETWKADLETKPTTFAKMGIKEYFTFDPTGVWTGKWRKKAPLLGWSLGAAGQSHEKDFATAGRLWSYELDSWLAVQPDHTLRLFDVKNQLRLTGEEVKEQQLAAERLHVQRLQARLRELGQNPDEM